MGPDDFDQEDARATRSTRRNSGQTERLPQREIPRGEPIRSDWLSGRTAGRTRKTKTVPSSRQELVLWLQDGGWRIIAVIAAITFVFILAIILLRPQPLATTRSEAQPTENLGAALNPQILPSVTPFITPTAELAAATSGAQFRVINTGSEGLFLRPAPNRDGAPIKTLPEGSIVTIIGEDFSGPDFVWKNVRDAEGAEGWVAAEFLEAVQ